MIIFMTASKPTVVTCDENYHNSSLFNNLRTGFGRKNNYIVLEKVNDRRWFYDRLTRVEASSLL